MKGRIRSIKPEAHLDEDLWDLESQTGYPLFRLFTGLWNYADRDGRFEWRPRALQAVILPWWNGNFEAALNSLCPKFVLKYESDGKAYGWIRTFARHQTPNAREQESSLPAPVTEEEESDSDLGEHAPPIRNGTRAIPKSVSWEGKGREGSSGTRGVPPRPPHDNQPPELEPGEPPPPFGAARFGQVWYGRSAQPLSDSRTRPAFENIAAALNREAPADPEDAAKTLVDWWFLAPDGPLKSGRVKRMRPWVVADGVSEDLEAAWVWRQSRGAAE